MSDEISPEIFNHLVGLAALELTADEGEYLRRQLNNQLNAIRELEAIPLSADVPLASHGVPYTLENSATPRVDEWHPYPNVQAILTQAPQFEEGYIVVPDIPHTTLE